MWFTLLVWVFWLSPSSLLSSVFSSPPHPDHQVWVLWCLLCRSPCHHSWIQLSLENPASAVAPPCREDRYFPTTPPMMAIQSWKWIGNVPEYLGLCSLRAGLPTKSANIPGSLISVYWQHPFTPLKIIRCRKLLRGIYIVVNILDWIPQPYEIFLSPNPLLYLKKSKGYFLNRTLQIQQ